MSLSKDPEQNETKYLRKFADFANKRVLEIGCGEGRLTWRYAASTAYVIGVDADKDAVRFATLSCPSDFEGKIHFLNTQAEHLPFRNETFDLVILAWSL